PPPLGEEMILPLVVHQPINVVHPSLVVVGWVQPVIVPVPGGKVELRSVFFVVQGRPVVRGGARGVIRGQSLAQSHETTARCPQRDRRHGSMHAEEDKLDRGWLSTNLRCQRKCPISGSYIPNVGCSI